MLALTASINTDLFLDSAGPHAVSGERNRWHHCPGGV